MSDHVDNLIPVVNRVGVDVVEGESDDLRLREAVAKISEGVVAQVREVAGDGVHVIEDDLIALTILAARAGANGGAVEGGQALDDLGIGESGRISLDRMVALTKRIIVTELGSEEVLDTEFRDTPG